MSEDGKVRPPCIANEKAQLVSDGRQRTTRSRIRPTPPWEGGRAARIASSCRRRRMKSGKSDLSLPANLILAEHHT